MGRAPAADLVTDHLAAVAAAAGVATTYVDANGQRVDVADRAVRGVLEALGVDPEGAVPPARPRGIVTHDGRLPAGTQGRVTTEDGDTAGVGDVLPHGWHVLVEPDGTRRTIVSGPRAIPELPETWGWWTHLAALRGPGSWGHGGVRELRSLVDRAAEQGAGAVLSTPLHPREPGDASPYSPTTRLHTDPSLIDVTALPEWGNAPGPVRRRVAALLPSVGADTSTGRAALDQALDLLAPSTWPSDDHAVWAALQEVHGMDVPVGAAPPTLDRVARHAWAFQRAAEQLRAVQQRARAAGMGIGLLHDVPVGVHPLGSDARILGARGVLATGASVGAPPDRLGPEGQDWQCPPWHPLGLAAEGYASWREAVRRAFTLGGGIRVDHVLGLWRLWWVPAGADPRGGTFVKGDPEVMLAGLVLEASRAGGMVVGEDLGTVPDEVTGALAAAGILGCDVAWFQDAVGWPAPRTWRRSALASVATHDSPTVAGWWLGEGSDADRQGLGDLVRAEVGDPEAFAGRLPGDRGGMHLASHALVAQSPARLKLWGLGDAVGDRRRPNRPGQVWPDYPSFRLPLADESGRAVPLPTVLPHPGVAALGKLSDIHPE